MDSVVLTSAMYSKICTYMHIPLLIQVSAIFLDSPALIVLTISDPEIDWPSSASNYLVCNARILKHIQGCWQVETYGPTPFFGGFATRPSWNKKNIYLPRKTNISTRKRPFQNETCLPTMDFFRGHLSFRGSTVTLHHTFTLHLPNWGAFTYLRRSISSCSKSKRLSVQQSHCIDLAWLCDESSPMTIKYLWIHKCRWSIFVDECE